MILIDANVLIYAFRKDCDNHTEYKAWLDTAMTTESVVGFSGPVFAVVIRVLTHPKVFVRPTPAAEALNFCDALMTYPCSLRVEPGERHWGIFKELVTHSGAKGNLVSDAYLAALAIENRAEWISADRDFARFPRLKWRHPLG